MYANQYEEHLAHSIPDNSRWDGFDRGTNFDAGEDYMSVRCIGRMTTEAGQRVAITETSFSDGCDTHYSVTVNGKEVFDVFANRARALTVARWWMDGCPA